MTTALIVALVCGYGFLVCFLLDTIKQSNRSAEFLIEATRQKLEAESMEFEATALLMQAQREFQQIQESSDLYKLWDESQ